MDYSVLSKGVKAKYYWGDKVPVSAVYECSVCGNYQAFKKGELFSQCQDCINKNEKAENRWYFTNQMTYFVSKNVNQEFEKTAGFELRVADKITEWAGSMIFVYFHILWFGAWIAINLGWFGHEYAFDPYPFGLLTMIVSLEAIFLATFIMISQNMQASKQELKSEHEYQMNLETEKNVAEILAILKDVKKDNEIKTETLTDTIAEIKDTIEEITAPVETLPDDAPIPPEVIENKEAESFEKQEEILGEAGIDVIQESAPPVILEEKKLKKPRKRKKKAKKEGDDEQSSGKAEDKSYKQHLIDDVDKLVNGER